MAKVRAKNTATAKDMMGCFVLWSREIDVESFRLSEQQVIVQNERLFSEIFEKTVRPGQKEVQQGLSMAYQIGVDEAKAISKSICNAFKFARSKIQSCSSGKKLEPAVWKFVQRLKTLSASSSSPSSRRSLDLEGSRPSVEEEVALKRKLEFGAPSKTEDEILAIYAAGSANAKSMDANVAMTGSSRDAISISESPSVVESSSETEAFQKKPGTAKPYFDPAEGCYIRLAEEGKVSRGVLEKGPAGFCLVRFEDEEPFPSEVPNLWLAPQAAESGPKLKRVRATGKGKGKGKGKSTKGSVAASAPEKAAADFEGNPGQEAGPVEGRAAEPIPAETSSASKKILFGVHDITGLPVEAQPPEGCKGQHSYTVKLDDGAISIDVLCRSNGFFVKKPEKCRAQFSWSLYDKPADAWYACVGACRDHLAKQKPKAAKTLN